MSNPETKPRAFIRLPVDCLNDYKIKNLSDRSFRRYFELYLSADSNGLIALTVTEAAWLFRCKPKAVTAAWAELEAAGLIERGVEGLRIVRFKVHSPHPFGLG